MSIQTVLNQLCVYFGGAYDPATHTYRTPQVTGLGVVRRAWPKRDDHAEYYHGMPPGSLNGCQMVVQASGGSESRAAVGGAVSGLKRLNHHIELHCFIRSTAPYAEDTQDYAYGLRDAIFTHIHTDRTCGSGGFEAGGFQIGEGGEPWLGWELAQARSSADASKSYLLITCDANEYVEA